MESEPQCLGEQVKLSVLRLISSRSCRLTVPSDYEREGTKSAHLFAHALVSVRSGCRGRKRLGEREFADQ